MIARDGYPPGVPCWVDTSQPDPAAAAEFYVAVLRDPQGAMLSVSKFTSPAEAS